MHALLAETTEVSYNEDDALDLRMVCRYITYHEVIKLIKYLQGKNCDLL